MIFENILHPIRWLFLFHAILGSIALIILFVPMFSAKGGKLHVKTGWIYTLAMIGVSVSAIVITPWRILFDPNKTDSSEALAYFLFYIAVFTVCALWYGLVALKTKTRTAPSRRISHLLPPAFLIVMGIRIQLMGNELGTSLLLIFPFLGHVTAAQQLAYWLRTPKIKKHWWLAHMDGMFIASIATVTAFLVTAVPRMSDGAWAHSPLLWFAPGIIGGTVLNRWKASYRKNFS